MNWNNLVLRNEINRNSFWYLTEPFANNFRELSSYIVKISSVYAFSREAQQISFLFQIIIDQPDKPARAETRAPRPETTVRRFLPIKQG